jgi:multidrug resistance efflux pump
MKKAIFRLVVLAILAAGGWYGYRWYQQLPSHQEQLATAKVQRGDVVIRAYTRGELHAVRSVTLVAPNLNGTVQVTRLAPMGALAREKDLIVEYDDSELQASLDEDQMSLEQTDQQIKGAKANLGVTDSEDGLSLLKQRYAVRSAELTVQKNPVTDVIDAKKNLLALEEAKRAVTQLEIDVAMRKAQNDSILAVLAEQRNRNLLDIKRDQLRIEQTKALADISGLVSIRQNRAGNFNFGQVMPDIREGDTLQPGMQVADVLDLSEVEVWAKVGELDRANLIEGQDAVLQLDSVPDKQFHGKVKALSGTATADVFSGDPSKKFDVVFSVDMRGLLAGLGMKSADVDRVMATAESNSRKNVTAGSPFASFQLTPQIAPGATPGAPAGVIGAAGQSQGAGAMPPGAVPGRHGPAGAAPGSAAVAGGRGPAGGTPGSAGSAAVAGAMPLGAAAPGGRGPAGGTQGSAGSAAVAGAMPPGVAAPGGRGQAAGAPGSPGSGAFSGGMPPGAATPGGAIPAGASAADLMAMMAIGGSQFTDEERKNARVPLPPEADSQLQMLLRPGLLADVEITVEKLPNVIHVPAQAVFQKDGQNIVYVQQQNGRFEPRKVELVKQSESIMVLAGGVQPGEVVALGDPMADKNAKKKDETKPSSPGNPMSSMPGGK